MSVFLLLILVVACSSELINGPCRDTNGTLIKSGSSWTSQNPCAMYTCYDSNKTSKQTFYEVQRCPDYTKTVKPPCYLKTYPYKDYPGCCPVPECPNSNPKPTGDGYANTGYIWNKFGHRK